MDKPAPVIPSIGITMLLLGFILTLTWPGFVASWLMALGGVISLGWLILFHAAHRVDH